MSDDKTGQTNAALNAAARNRNEEFYTREDDIENELKHYREHFRGATVYCNCDDPTVSGFWQYFTRNFKLLKLKRLITTCYKSKNPFGWTRYKDGNGMRIDYDGRQKTRKLRGDGDFRGDECIRILREADIVCTNPPFSLWRDYVARLVAENKRFLIIGNFNAVHYQDIFRLIAEEKVWLGFKKLSGGMLFNVPKGHAEWLVANRIEGRAYRIVDGNVLALSSAIWYTNLDHEKRHLDLNLRARYGDGSAYPKYDNYDAIEVSRVADIPRDYAGVMGVPDTFLEKYSPSQFELVGKLGNGVVNGKAKYSRMLIRNRRPK